MLGNYTFLTLKFSIQRTNIYADANGQILKGFLTHHGMQIYTIRWRLAKSGLEELRSGASAGVVPFTRPYSTRLWGMGSIFRDRSRATDLPSFAYFRCKRFCWFFAVFWHKSEIDPEPGDLDVLTSLRTSEAD